MLTLLFGQKLDYSYYQKIKKSWIDHVILRKDNKMIEQINIIQDDENFGDHLAISINTNYIGTIFERKK